MGSPKRRLTDSYRTHQESEFRACGGAPGHTVEAAHRQTQRNRKGAHDHPNRLQRRRRTGNHRHLPVGNRLRDRRVGLRRHRRPTQAGVVQAHLGHRARDFPGRCRCRIRGPEQAATNRRTHKQLPQPATRQRRRAISPTPTDDTSASTTAPTSDPPPEPKPDGTYTSSCDYVLGDFSSNTSSGFRFVATATAKNTGNIGTVLQMKAQWFQVGTKPVLRTKKVKVGPGRSSASGSQSPFPRTRSTSSKHCPTTRNAR